MLINVVGTPISHPIPKREHQKKVVQTQNEDIQSSPVAVTKELELRIVAEYLVNPKTSFRKLEREYMGIDSPARGGGFVAKNIVNSYGIGAEMKGILANNTIDSVILNAAGKKKSTLLAIKELL